jgi:hypothetical protein
VIIDVNIPYKKLTIINRVNIFLGLFGNSGLSAKVGSEITRRFLIF